MEYRCVATSVAGFVQQLAVGYIAQGYYFYVAGRIPKRKDPTLIDRKLIALYDINLSKWTRSRRKKAGLANVQYLRFERFFVLLATRGEHPFFETEAGQIRDIRKRPLLFMGYSIGCRRARGGGAWHASVRVEQETFGELKAYFGRIAVHRPVDSLAGALRSLPYEPYAPVRDQLRILLRQVNRRRKAAGLALVARDVLNLRRKPVKPFE